MPEPVFKYRSNFLARNSEEKAVYVTMNQGLNLLVCLLFPEL